ncbi:carbohydrate ABC transporter membrane protein 2, CUT1 family [Oribacterium sp. KHPX15]|uniref:carbohydrate ABC transporter permease n=1 Tax=Oribacterium sp. KHPX15 TaxID=1855342 RepID=UPI000898D8F8|nr:carbohydrate ABC transporter permease [Oribacterium sp. KHPX15]SEA62633.1 carbohydrate ABC transporter membrane protein 2, CUT1 family [Oribacterium sp. KHPX15]
MINSKSGGYIKGLGRGSNAILSIFMLLFSGFMIIPVILILAISLSSEDSIAKNGYRFVPAQWSTDAYSYIIKSADNITRAFGLTFVLTLIGTILSLFLISTMAYVLSNRDYSRRKVLIWFIMIPMFFSGGLAASYAVNTQFFGMKNSVLALILPEACSSWYIIVMRTYFMKNISEEVLEAARLDGASAFRLYFRFVLPMSKPILLTVGIFEAFSYWNSWYANLIYTDSAHSRLYTLQYILYNMEKNASYLTSNENVSGAIMNTVPTESLRMALASMIILPVIVVYPFFRKHFLRGLNAGVGK